MSKCSCYCGQSICMRILRKHNKNKRKWEITCHWSKVKIVLYSILESLRPTFESLGSLLQFAEECEPCLLVNGTFICIVFSTLPETKYISNSHSPFVSVTTMILAPSLTKNWWTSSNGEFDWIVKGAYRSESYGVSPDLGPLACYPSTDLVHVDTEVERIRNGTSVHKGGGRWWCHIIVPRCCVEKNLSISHVRNNA
jgi:hypothetical protein